MAGFFVHVDHHVDLRKDKTDCCYFMCVKVKLIGALAAIVGMKLYFENTLLTLQNQNQPVEDFFLLFYVLNVLFDEVKWSIINVTLYKLS